MDPAFLNLMAAAYQGNAEQFATLLAAEPELATKRSSCSHPTLLQFIAVEAGLGKITEPTRFAEQLIEAGSPLDEPLVAAASVDARDILDAILAAGASVEAGAPWTPLEEAVYWRKTALAEYLFNDRDAQVRSLRAAAGLGALALIDRFFDHNDELLPDAGPARFAFGPEDPHPHSVLDQALLIALLNARYSAADHLVERGARVSPITPCFHDQCTPLHLAARNDDRTMVDWLLDHEADPTVQDPRFGATASEWARHFEHPEMGDHIDARTVSSD